MTHFANMNGVTAAVAHDASDAFSVDQVQHRLAGWRGELLLLRTAWTNNGARMLAAEIDRYLMVLDDQVIARACEGHSDALELAVLSDRVMSLLRAVQRTERTLPPHYWTNL